MEAVISCPGSDRTLQFDAEKKSWLVTVQGNSYTIGDGSDQSIFAVLPFLELPFIDFERHVSELLAKHLDLSFPYELFVRAGFRHGSPHWTDCSLKWLAELDELDADFSEELEKVIANKRRYSQKSRQLAKKLMKRRAFGHSVTGST
jgi:hypothetical protein